MSLDILSLLVGLTIGTVIGWLLSHFVYVKQQTEAPTSIVDMSKFVSREQHEELKGILLQRETQLAAKSKETEEMGRDLSASERTVEHYNERLRSQQDEIAESQRLLRSELENLANSLLEEKSRKFTEQNQQNLTQLLSPLQERLLEFEQRMAQAQTEETKQRSSLTEQIRFLADLNQQMGDDARSLTRALRGDSKAQGNWGELVLERVLEKSGLQRGREYTLQATLFETEGAARRPDVLIHLPGGRHLVIDSKVSLTAYERANASTEPAQQQIYQKEHLSSLKTHIKQLSEKNYAALHGINAPDLVFLFVPVEAAYMSALQQDPELYYDALSKNIVVAGPSTLIAAARTVSTLWRQEQQNRNAQEIARLGGELYDRFVSFVIDLEGLGQRLRQGQQSYDELLKKLHHGRGSLAQKAQQLKTLGARTNKEIPDKYLEEGEEV